MTETVNIIEAFNTRFGRVLTVKNDRVFRVGQTIHTNEGVYRISMIRAHYDPEVNLVALNVEPV